MTSKIKQNPVQLLLKVVDDGNLLLLKNLLQKPDVNINGTNKHGEGALHIAAGYGRLKIVKVLHEAGAHLDITDKQGDTPLYWASRHGHCEVVQYLCNNEVNINHQDKAGETAAHVTSRYAHPEVLYILCEYGADLDLQDKDGETPIHGACWHGYQIVVEYLVQSGCSLLIRNNNGETPLHVAAVRGCYTILRYLCDHGAEINPVNQEGHTPLYLATCRNHLDIVQYLCEKKCDLDIQNLNGDTALHEACREGHLSLVYTLYASSCNLNIRNKNGKVPLHLAAQYGHTEIVRCLCSAGCDLNITNKDGHTADVVARRAGHQLLGDMLNFLLQDGVREQCLDELTLGTTQAKRVRLLVCGASGVGKSELIASLRTRFLRTFRQQTCGGSYLGSATMHHTYGFCVQNINIPTAGDFSIWDFSGRQEYYPIHEFFLDSRNAIYLIVFNSLQSFEVQLSHVRFWLAMIRSKHRPNEFIHYAGNYGQKPYVILVSSFADNPTILPASLYGSEDDFENDIFAATSPVSEHIYPLSKRTHISQIFTNHTHQIVKDERKSILQHAVEEFGDHFMFTDTVFHLDCRLSRGRYIRALRGLLGTLRVSVLQQQPWMPELVTTLQHVLPQWRKENSIFPVMTWTDFLSHVQESVNPLVSEERLKIVAGTLNDIGEIVHIKEGHLKSVIILDADWLGQRIFGPALSPEHAPIPKLRSITGQVSLREIERVYPELDPLSVSHLFEHFELCRPIGSEIAFEFPLLIKMEPLFGLWEREPGLSVYSGVRIQTTSVANIFSPSLFARAQLHIRKVFSDDIEDQELILWTNGLKCCRGEVEICIKQLIPNCTIEIAVRGTEETRTECYALLQQLYTILIATIHISNPGTVFTTNVLSMRSLVEHSKHPHSYTSMEIFEAERTMGMLTPSSPDEDPESICDLLCCGWEGAEITAKSAPYTSIRDIPLQTRVQLCRMLDPPDPFGRDWCLLALQLGLQDEVPEIDMSPDFGSPTNKLLLVWERRCNQNIVSLVDALQSIGRDDVAEEVVNGLSPFNNPNSSLIVNIGGVVATSYLV